MIAMPANGSHEESPMLHRADRLDRLATGFGAIVSMVLTVVMVAVVLLAVGFRYVLNDPLVYSYDLSTLLFGWMVFLGLGVAERDGAHLGLDVLGFLVPPRVERAAALVRQILVIVIAVYLAWVATRLTLRTGMEITSMRISQKWLYASMPIGFGLLAFSYALRLPILVRRLARGG